MVTFRFLSLKHRLAAICAAVLLLSVEQGCKREEIQVYRVAKDPSPSSEPTGATAPGPDGAQSAPMPKVSYSLPAGWQDLGAGERRAASFAIAGSGDRTAEVLIIPFLGVAMGDLDLVNIWREQMQMGPITEGDLAKFTQPISAGKNQGKLFELVSDKPLKTGTNTLGILAATLQKGETTWLVKMGGDDSLVKEQKPAFIKFLETLAFEEAEVAAAPQVSSRRFSANSKEAPRSVDTKPNWTTPPDWQEVPGGAMLVAKFVVSGKDGTKADVNIGQAGGGAGANIVRWRNQLGLPAASPEEAEKSGSSLDLPSGKSLVVDLKGTDARTGQPSRILGVISPRGSEMWFYKFMGNPELVEARKEEFLGFVRSVTYPHAP